MTPEKHEAVQIPMIIGQAAPTRLHYVQWNGQRSRWRGRRGSRESSWSMTINFFSISSGRSWKKLAARSWLWQAAWLLFKCFPRLPEFDLVITDEKMPELSGTDLLERILILRPDLPVVLHTDYPDTASTSRAHAIGVRTVLAKSPNMNQLITSIRSLLEG